MGECPRCGNIHAAGYCPIYGSNEQMHLTPTYAEAMRSLAAETRLTRGDGNMCLFHALVGEEDGTGAIAESNGQAAGLRMRAGELMANGYARSLSNESESLWNAHVKSMTRTRLRWLPRGACQATVSACAAAMHRNIVRADVFPDGGPGTRGTTVFALFPQDDDVMIELTVEEARQAIADGAAFVVWASGHYERAVVNEPAERPLSAGPRRAAQPK